jgi:hypothetical protein
MYKGQLQLEAEFWNVANNQAKRLCLTNGASVEGCEVNGSRMKTGNFQRANTHLLSRSSSVMLTARTQTRAIMSVLDTVLTARDLIIIDDGNEWTIPAGRDVGCEV